MNHIFVSVFIVVGTLFILIAAIGLLRFKDLFSRMHASTKATSFGILLLLVGVILYFSIWAVTFKSVLIILFIYLTSPLAAHSIAKSFRDDTNKNNSL